MPKSKKGFALKKKFLFIAAALVFLSIVYLNVSYAHIFDYDKSWDITRADLKTNFSLGGGNGEESIRYVALGDSLTYGFGASEYKSTFPYTIAQNLLNKYAEVEVLNLGVPGAVIGELVEVQLPKALGAKPKFVTVMIGTNDVHDFTDEQEFRKSLVLVVERLKQIDCEVMLINVPFLGTRDLILFPHNIIMDQRIKKFNKIIKEVSLEKEVRYFDLYTASKPHFSRNPEKYYSYDRFHPSNEGYSLWGRLINAN